MKKIILILALLSLGVSKAQVVGGYLPLNSTKSATMGGLRVNGTSTFTGNALFSSSVGIGALPNFSLSYLRVSKNSNTIDLGGISSSYSSIWLHQSTPTGANYVLSNDGSNSYYNSATSSLFMIGGVEKFKVTSSSFSTTVGGTINGNLITTGTHSLGSANLTGGNTGTVAVRTDNYFTIFCNSQASSPTDGTAYYFGSLNTAFNTSKLFSIPMPYACTLIGWNLQVFTGGTIGSNESATLSIVANNSSTVNLSTSVIYTLANTPAASNGFFSMSGSGLSTNFAAGDYFFPQITSPTWVTNPTLVIHALTLFFRRND